MPIGNNEKSFSNKIKQHTITISLTYSKNSNAGDVLFARKADVFTGVVASIIYPLALRLSQQRSVFHGLLHRIHGNSEENDMNM